MNNRHAGLWMPLLALGLAMATPQRPAAQVVEGTLFDDRNGNGTLDAGEPPVDGIAVTVWGASGESTAVTVDGRFSIPTRPGCQAVHVAVPTEGDPALEPASPAWRPSFPDQTDCPPPGSEPVGITRYGAPRNLRANLSGPDGFLHVSLGDSIAAGVSFCSLLLGQDTDYIDDVADGLRCLASGLVTLDNRAVPGRHSEDLFTPLERGAPNGQFIPSVVAAAPDLVTLSIGGNDFLEVDAARQQRPFDAGQLAANLAELIATRQTIQEAASVLTTELPEADIEINTVYDNEAHSCDTTDFHAAIPAVWNQVLRNAAFGQIRPAVVAEVAHDFAHQDVLRTRCCGAEDQICTSPFDGIHPNADGTHVIEEGVMEALGRVQVDPVEPTTGVNVGLQRQVATLRPRVAEVFGGTVSEPDSATALDGVAASADTGGAWIELSDFCCAGDDVVPSRVIVGVRYRTSGPVDDDIHRFEASFLNFAPPDLTVTGWDTVSPIVGASGTEGSLAPPFLVNALPTVDTWRDVTATVTLNLVDDGTVTGDYLWADPTLDDLSRLRVRLTTEAVGAPDGATVEWDGAWAWVYGEAPEAPTIPGEVSAPGSPTPLEVRREADGLRLSWATEPVSTTYRAYQGEIGAWSTAAVDAAASQGGCSATTSLVLATQPAGNAYFLVTGISAAGLEGPLGSTSEGASRASGPATCP